MPSRTRQLIAKAVAAAKPVVDSETHELTHIRVHEVSVVDRAANKRTFLVTKKDLPGADLDAKDAAASGTNELPGADLDAFEKAKWTAAYINDLPDSSFLYVETGGAKDEDGKTTPRSLRHFPVKDKDGNVDAAHVRNALARIPQSDVSDAAKEKVKAKGEKMLESVNKDDTSTPAAVAITPAAVTVGSTKADVTPLPEPVAADPVAAMAALAASLNKSTTVAAPAVVATAVSNASMAAATPAPVPSSAASVDKSSVTVLEPQVDGSIKVTTDVVVEPTPSTPAVVMDAMKVSVLAGIDAIALRVATLRDSVANSKGSWSTSGTPMELQDIWYIRDMLCALWDIGGPNWEIEQAADAALSDAASTVTGMAKADVAAILKNKIISRARVAKLVVAHKAMEWAHADMKKVLKELDTEGGDATGEMARGAAATSATQDGTAASGFAKATTEKDIKQNPEYLAMKAELDKTKQAFMLLQQTNSEQAGIIAKARGSIPSSNAAIEKTATSEDDSGSVIWDRDLASPSKPISKSFGRDSKR